MLQITRRDSTRRVVVEALAEVFRGGHPRALYVIRTRPDIGAVTTLRFDAQPRFSWFWTNSLQAEGWFNDSLSLGVSSAWNIAWGFPVPSGQVASAPRDANGNLLSPTFTSATDTVTGRVFFTWAIEPEFSAFVFRSSR